MAARWHIVGDSHTRAMRWAAEHGLVDRACVFVEVIGATAGGLRNPNAHTDALATFRKSLLPYDPDVVPVVHLGEVDCGFVIWYRAAKYGEPVQQQLEQSLAGYFDFVDQLTASGYDRLVISGATLPTIREGQDWGDVPNARREVKQPLAARTRLTLSYNQKLAQGAAQRGLHFIDIVEEIIDPTTGTVSDRFRHPDPTDHHLDPEKTGPLWAKLLNGLSDDWR